MRKQITSDSPPRRAGVGSHAEASAESRGFASRTRIMDVAEQLFREHGFEATSMRAITAAAGVNLAAANYHFGSKEALFEAVLRRRLDPMNQRRVELLAELEKRWEPAPVPCDRILSALLLPALELSRDPERGGANFLRLLGRAYADPAPFIRQFLSEQYATMIRRFKAAFGRALPELPKRELSWRLHFMMGALSYTLAGTDTLKLIAEITGNEAAHDDELLLRRLAPFLLAGLTAPLAEIHDPEAPRERTARVASLRRPAERSR